MSIPRRGYLAAGLAVTVVGSLGGFALHANADETAAAPAPAAAEAPAGPEAAEPPALLPWGDEPTPMKAGPPDATSAQLAAMGADYAPRRGPRVQGPRTSPKGFISKKRTLRSSSTTVPPLPPSRLSAAVPKKRTANYHYSAAYQFVESDGTYASLTVDKPTLGKNDYHTLAEIGVQSRDGRQAVEVGWTVDRGNNGGSEDPHLFVYHWVDDVGQEYNNSKWVPYDSDKDNDDKPDGVQPGDKLTTGTSLRIGVVSTGDGWWVAVDTIWIGHFPASEWQGRFTRTGLVQWFGEVASTSLNPCSSMGGGVGVSEAKTARIGSITLVGVPEHEKTPNYTLDVSSKHIYKNERGKDVEVNRPGGPAYEGAKASAKTLYYGGPVPLLPGPDLEKKSDDVPNPACVQ